MALALAFVNEVLGQVDSTVVLDQAAWETVITAFKFEGRDLETQVLGRMRLRMAPGGYDGVLEKLAALVKENEELKAQVEQLTKPEPIHA